MAGAQPQRRAPDGSGGGEELRERLVAAISKAAADHGYAGFTVEQAVRNAGVSRETFDRHFEGREQALLAAQNVFLDWLLTEAEGACKAPDEWPQRVRAALGAVIGSLVETSALARALAVESVANLAAAERHLRALERFALMLRVGRRHYPAATSLPDSTERVLIGGVAAVFSAHLRAEDPAALPALEPQLTELLLLPYLGATEARRVAWA